MGLSTPTGREEAPQHGRSWMKMKGGLGDTELKGVGRRHEIGGFRKWQLATLAPVQHQLLFNQVLTNTLHKCLLCSEVNLICHVVNLSFKIHHHCHTASQMPYKTYPVSVTGDFVFFYVNIHPSNNKIPNKQNQETS